MKRSALDTRILVLALAAVTGACRSGSNASPSLVTNTPNAEAKTTPPVRGAMPLPVVHVVLDDPRLAKARELDRAKDPAGALRAMREARPADLPQNERCAWDFVCTRRSRSTPSEFPRPRCRSSAARGSP